MTDISLLVADDEAMVRVFVKTVIEREKLPVSKLWEADNGAAAIQITRQHRPDLILLDVRMPEVDGLRAAQLILEENRQAAVVIVSAYSDFEYARTAFRAGVLDFLLKPVRPKDLAELIKRMAAAKVTIAASKAAKSDLVTAVEQYVEANLASPIQLKDIAGGIFIRPCHLSRKFKQATGQSIVEFIQHFRLTKAERLLQETNLPITEVAGRVGYNNPAYFATCFKSRLGMTPLQFRKQQEIDKR